jgi:hypothetical protein
MGQFGDKIRQFATIVEERADDVVTEAIQEVGRRLITRSPVDTGRFVSNWRYQAGAPNILFEDAVRHVRVVNDIGDIAQPATAFVHFVSNSAPYATALERGHSKQAPQGFVGLTGLEWQSIVAAAAIKVAA